MCILQLRSICKSLASESSMFSSRLYLLAASQAEAVASSALSRSRWLILFNSKAITLALCKMSGGGGHCTAKTNLEKNPDSSCGSPEFRTGEDADRVFIEIKSRHRTSVLCPSRRLYVRSCWISVMNFWA